MITFLNRFLSFSSRSTAARRTDQSVMPPFSALNSKIRRPFVPGSVLRNSASGNVLKVVVFPIFSRTLQLHP
jgi:hypothetical protein